MLGIAGANAQWPQPCAVARTAEGCAARPRCLVVIAALQCDTARFPVRGSVMYSKRTAVKFSCCSHLTRNAQRPATRAGRGAERVGFEPTDGFTRHFLSREARSARLRHLSLRQRSYTTTPTAQQADTDQPVNGTGQRRGRDSNPRRLSPQRFSRPSQSSTLPPLQVRHRPYRLRQGARTRFTTRRHASIYLPQSAPLRH